MAGPGLRSLARSRTKPTASLLRFFESFGSAVQLGDMLRDGRRAVVGVDGGEVRSLVKAVFLNSKINPNNSPNSP